MNYIMFEITNINLNKTWFLLVLVVLDSVKNIKEFRKIFLKKEKANSSHIWNNLQST